MKMASDFAWAIAAAFTWQVNLITQEPNIELENKQNERLSGKYLVSMVNHNMDQNTLTTQVEIVKYGWQKGDV